MKGGLNMEHENKITVFTVLKVLFLLFILAITLYPFIYMISVSLSKNIYVMRNEVKFLPKGFNLKMYEIVLRDPRILKAYWNTILYVSVGTFISLSSTCMAAYALSKEDKLLFHKFFSIMIVITMFFGGGMIPTYLTVRGLGLYNTM